MATIKYWDGSAWQYAVVGKQGPVGATGPTGPVGEASLQRFRFVATGGETSLSGTDANGNTLAYTSGLEEVFLNGVALVRGQDYTATNGTSITGLTALVASDVVEILAWGVFNVSNTISNTLVDAKGDLLVGSAADTVSRLAVGSANQVLTVDSSTATGLKWAAIPASTTSFTLLNSGGTALTAATTVTVNVSSYNQYFIKIDQASSTNASSALRIRLNSDSAGNYGITKVGLEGTAVANTFGFSETVFDLANMGTADTNAMSGFVAIHGGKGSGIKYITAVVRGAGSTSNASYSTHGMWDNSAAITSISFISSTGNWDNGTVYIYGA